jgi:hypothetical protein
MQKCKLQKQELSKISYCDSKNFVSLGFSIDVCSQNFSTDKFSVILEAVRQRSRFRDRGGQAVGRKGVFVHSLGRREPRGQQNVQPRLQKAFGGRRFEQGLANFEKRHQRERRICS